MEDFQQIIITSLPVNLAEFSITTATSFVLITAAEIGDKSQLVCMVLATRYRAMPVLAGAIAAFLLLNTLAVVFGGAVANWLPDYWVAAIVALLFAFFGCISLFNHQPEVDEEIQIEKTGHGIFLNTFMLITLAEFGDKTQLAVVAYSSTASPLAVWLGSIFALTFTSALGILVGVKLLQKIPLSFLHKISGILFILLAMVAAHKSYAGVLAANLLPPGIIRILSTL
jgi:putative Ca2+/H+ antiporter (TMEM165/GDT1 family)